jgi:two-component system response regulator HydG
MSGRVLVVDDDPAMCEMVRAHLVRRGYQATTHQAAPAAFEALRSTDFDVVVTDLQMRGMNGLELCERIVADRPDVPVIVITAFGSLELAIAAIRVGAYDFVPKPFNIEQLCIALDRAIQHRSLRQEVRRLQDSAQALRPEHIVGESSAMRGVFDLLERIGDSEATVMVTGESGTGKELVARAVHRRSRRSEGPFVAINCAAFPETLLESELFGHERGAFTDARTSRVGLFAQANGGTLFLDEIGDVPLGLQPKLLRAVQERKVRPLGGRDEVDFDARIIAATNRDLESAVAERRFREDLYYRINVIRVELPPLRARGADVLLIAQGLLERAAAASRRSIRGISPAAAERLVAYPWPGNVRELQNCIERAVALARYGELVVEDLPESIRDYHRSHVVVASDDPSELASMEDVERRYILRVLEATGSNKSLAARILGFDRTTLYRKLVRYGVEVGGRPE